MPQPTNEGNTEHEGSSPKDANRPTETGTDAQQIARINNDSKEDEKNLGSGLASFFGDLFPGRDEPVEFSTSLSEFRTAKDPASQAKTIGVEYVDGGLTYKEWRSKEKGSLTKYLVRRLHPHPETQDDGLESENEDEIEDEKAEKSQQPESQMFGMETQEPMTPLNVPKSVKKRKQHIPFVDDCMHDLNKLEFLDLHARTLSLNLSKIHKVWRLRNTKRKPAFSSIRKPAFRAVHAAPIKQRLVFEDYEEDGPVSTIYQKVLHLEVEQLHLESGTILGSNKEEFPQRIKVFFYDSYATAVAEWIKEQEQQQHRRSGTKRKHNDNTTTSIASTDIILSLSKIPARCIFPYTIDPRNWREQKKIVDYCLCIGDKSGAKIRTNQQQDTGVSGKEQIRFDSNDMEIRLMTVVTKTCTSEAETEAGIIISNESFEEVDLSSELVLSKHTLSQNLMFSSSEENTPVESVPKPPKEDIPNPLQTSWESYQKNRGHKKGIPNHSSNSRPPLRQLNQKNQEQSQENQSLTKSKHAKITNSDNEGNIDVAPMIIEGGIQRRSDSKSIDYVTLEEITNMVEQSISARKGCNFKVNLYASVVAVTPPRRTKRGDWMIAATLLDESCPMPMTINIFCKKQERLPQLIWMGDVIRIHRAAVEKWYNKIQLQGLAPTQYVVIRKMEGSWKVIPTAVNGFTFNRSDEERSQALWRWANEHSEKSPSMKPEHCFTLDEMRHLKTDDDKTTFEHKDITVMVVQKLGYHSSDVLPHGLLRVWDGTGTPPSDPLFMPVQLVAPPPEEQREAAYSRAVEKVISTSQQLQASVSGGMEIPLSLTGQVSNVVIWEKSHWALIQKHIPVGTFLRLRNVHIPQRWEGNNFRSIFMHDKSWMTGLPTNNFEVRSLLFHHNERVRKYGSSCYNKEFGGPSGAACGTFVGNGLSNFCNEETGKMYTGAVRIRIEAKAASGDAMGTNVILSDRSGSFPVVATPKIYQELQSNSSLDAASRFLITIFRIVVNANQEDEQQQFVLTNLALLDR